MLYIVDNSVEYGDIFLGKMEDITENVDNSERKNVLGITSR